jgi:hypothetical protein
MITPTKIHRRLKPPTATVSVTVVLVLPGGSHLQAGARVRIEVATEFT